MGLGCGVKEISCGESVLKGPRKFTATDRERRAFRLAQYLQGVTMPAVGNAVKPERQRRHVAVVVGVVTHPERRREGRTPKGNGDSRRRGSDRSRGMPAPSSNLQHRTAAEAARPPKATPEPFASC